jgi:hypothetical protein
MVSLYSSGVLFPTRAFSPVSTRKLYVSTKMKGHQHSITRTVKNKQCVIHNNAVISISPYYYFMTITPAAVKACDI